VSAVEADSNLTRTVKYLVFSQSGTWTNSIKAKSSLAFDVSSLSADQAAAVPDVASAYHILNNYVSLSEWSSRYFGTISWVQGL